MEIGLTLLAQAGLSPKYWVDSFLTSTYLINRLPIPVLKNQSPFSKLFNRSPDYTSLRSFGCLCFPLLRPYANHKLSFRSKPCILLGYAANQKGYRCLEPQSHKIYISRHVVFDENVFLTKGTSLSQGSYLITATPGNSLVMIPSHVSIEHLTSTTHLPPGSSHSIPVAAQSTSLTATETPNPDQLNLSATNNQSHTSCSPSPTSLTHTSSQANITSPPLPAPPSNRVITRSQTGHLKPKEFPGFKLFHVTKHPILTSQAPLLLPTPLSFKQAVVQPEWMNAMTTEYNALLSNQTWSLCPRPLGHNVVRNKWVYKIKQKADGSVDRFKARLDAKGFDQQSGVDYYDTFSPVIKTATIRLVLALAVQFDWDIKQLDVSNAFLHGILDEEVYMEQPQGFVHPAYPDHVCRLHKSLMSLLSWNCRGLGNLQAVRDLCRLVKDKKPNLVFLMETKLPSHRMEAIKFKIGYASNFVVDNVGRSGGLALIWSEEVRVDIQNFSQRHISAKVQMEANGNSWYLTGFYGQPDVGKRHEAWSLLRHLRLLSLCVGDFNEIMEESEKFEGPRKPQGQMGAFCDTLRDCQLHDLGYVGAQFTWSNMRHDGEFVKERLDKATTTDEWRDLYPRRVVEVLANRSSDHNALLISFNGYYGRHKPWIKKFRFEAEWNGIEQPKAIIKKIWKVVNRGTSAWQRVGSKLIDSKKALSKWARKESRPVEEIIKTKTCAIEKLQTKEGMIDVGALAKLQKKVNELIAQEDTHLCQRAKVEWLKAGDKNFKFFHACIAQCWRTNQVGCITDETGAVFSSTKTIEAAFINYFSGLLALSNPEGCGAESQFCGSQGNHSYE
jgi:hypothetical protein